MRVRRNCRKKCKLFCFFFFFVGISKWLEASEHSIILFGVEDMHHSKIKQQIARASKDDHDRNDTDQDCHCRRGCSIYSEIFIIRYVKFEESLSSIIFHEP